LDEEFRGRDNLTVMDLHADPSNCYVTCVGGKMQV
jgi:hypothetical protein